ncbi:MAG: ABC transporter substrate-binding protein [Chthonomonas sp.]|nr:ABC transporter substrate-binding protein [Chthonomonas sp.]
MARLLAFLLPILLIIGCQPEQTHGGTFRNKRIQTVVSLSPSTSEIVASYFPGIKIMGRTASCDYPDTLKAIPIMGGVKPDYEAIARVRPDLVLYDSALYNDADIEKLKQLKIESYAFGPKTLDAYVEELYDLGSKLGGETEMSEYIDRIMNAKIGNTSDSADKRRVMIVLGGAGEHMVAGTKSLQADMLRWSGFEPVGPDADRFVTVNVESIISENPDAIVVAGDGKYILEDARLKGLAAVAKKRVAEIGEQSLILRAGGRVDMLLQNLRPAVEGLFVGK